MFIWLFVWGNNSKSRSGKFSYLIWLRKFVSIFFFFSFTVVVNEAKTLYLVRWESAKKERKKKNQNNKARLVVLP